MDQRKNILIIMSDDQGAWAMGCDGNREIRTPSLDRLAAGGMRFTHFFCTSPVCSPARASFLTGRMPSQHGVHDWLKLGNLDIEEGTMWFGKDRPIEYLEGLAGFTDILAANGYVCGLSGKWHLGHSAKPQKGHTWWCAHSVGGSHYFDYYYYDNGPELLHRTDYISDFFTDKAIEFLDRRGRGSNPFCLSVHYTAPHSPWTGHPQPIVDSYNHCPFASCPQEPRHPWAISLTDHCLGNREMLKGYFAAVTAMDDNVGRILKRLDERGLRDNTLVIFISDNGFSCGHHGFWGKGNGTNPRNMYENSVKVPAIFNYPASIPRGQVEKALVSAYDFFPTLLEFLGLPVPEDRNLPGKSFAPLLRGQEMKEREDVVIFDEYGPVRMVRTKEWKYVYRHAHGPHELFDLKNDPDERRNLAGDPAQAKRIQELKAIMDEWFARYVNPKRDGLVEDGGGMGQTRYIRG